MCVVVLPLIAECLSLSLSESVSFYKSYYIKTKSEIQTCQTVCIKYVQFFGLKKIAPALRENRVRELG